ncbi:hypothetical protein D3C86_2027390 [compost metagenome]
MIVPPERETPGISAIAWAKPKMMPSRQISCLSAYFFLPMRSAQPRIRPKAISITAVIYMLRKPCSIWSLKPSPRMMIGSEPMMISQPIRAASLS